MWCDKACCLCERLQEYHVNWSYYHGFCVDHRETEGKVVCRWCSEEVQVLQTQFHGKGLNYLLEQAIDAITSSQREEAKEIISEICNNWRQGLLQVETKKLCIECMDALSMFEICPNHRLCIQCLSQCTQLEKKCKRCFECVCGTPLLEVELIKLRGTPYCLECAGQLLEQGQCIQCKSCDAFNSVDPTVIQFSCDECNRIICTKCDETTKHMHPVFKGKQLLARAYNYVSQPF